MTTSPKGYPFEHIDYDTGSLTTLHGHLTQAVERVEVMRLVLRNVTNNLEGHGQALSAAKAMAGDLAAALAVPAPRVGHIASIVSTYGDSADTHGGSANRLMQDVTDALSTLGSAEADLSAAQAALRTWEGTDAYQSWRSGESDATRSVLNRDSDTRDALDSASTAHALAASGLNDAWDAWERSYEAWDDAYAHAVASLAAVDGGYTSAADTSFLTALADADTPAEVESVWNTLSDEEKAYYVEHFSTFIGNLDGIPYEYRIAANILVLGRAAQRSWGEPTDTDIATLQLQLREGGLPLSLNLFGENQATAAVLYVDGFAYDPEAFVNPLTGVTNVNVLLGGMLTEVNQMEDWGDSALAINSGIAEAGGRGATIVWFGYDTPNLGTVGSTAQAETGAEDLTTFLRGLDHAAPPTVTTTVIGHSYGSTTAFLAVGSAEDHLGVDNLISVGSAGLTDRALGDDPDARVDYTGVNIYASTSPEDRLAKTGRWAPPLTNVFTWGTHPIDPGSLDGAVNFDSNGGYGPNPDGSEPSAEHHGEELVQTPGHGTHSEGDGFIGDTGYPGGYLQDGSESFANIVEIINTGEPLTTPGGYGSDDWWLW